jgi:hypothetical protein
MELPKKGNGLHFESRGVVDETIYRAAVGDALRAELGNSHRATKTVMHWTGASERTAKNWLHGDAGPSGAHLLSLARNSDGVFAAMLRLADRQASPGGERLDVLRESLLTLVTKIDQIGKTGPEE